MNRTQILAVLEELKTIDQGGAVNAFWKLISERLPNATLTIMIQEDRFVITVDPEHSIRLRLCRGVYMRTRTAPGFNQREQILDLKRSRNLYVRVMSQRGQFVV